jgi:DNA-binding NarL/FixJ family response regulator
MSAYDLAMVLAVVDDLLFSSKIRSAAAAGGETIVFVRQADRVLTACTEHRPRLVIIDLDRDSLNPIETIAAIRAQPGLSPAIVGFGMHVNVDRLRAARAAGCDEAIPRSAFVAALPSMLSPAASESV